MTYEIMIVLSAAILLSYVLDFVSRALHFPSVILLLGVGIGLQITVNAFGLTVPVLNDLLPITGNIGLILIVLEGSMELTITSEKKLLILKSFLSAVIILSVLVFIFTYGFMEFFETDLRTAMLNAIPIAIISSAVVIPSIGHLTSKNREFIIYESTFSDITGILLFNFVDSNDVILWSSVSREIWFLVLMIIISVILTAILAFFIEKVNHHVKFLPIISFLVLGYAIGKYYHLSPLILIFIFGLLLNNYRTFLFDSIQKFISSDKLDTDLRSFKHITAEAVFVARTFFFILFGYVADLSQLNSMDNWAFAFLIFFILVIVRFLYLFITDRNNIRPLLFYAPRGLITVLLFISIPATERIPEINETVILMVVFLTILLMIFGRFGAVKKSD